MKKQSVFYASKNNPAQMGDDFWGDEEAIVAGNSIDLIRSSIAIRPHSKATLHAFYDHRPDLALSRTCWRLKDTEMYRRATDPHAGIAADAFTRASASRKKPFKMVP